MTRVRSLGFGLLQAEGCQLRPVAVLQPPHPSAVEQGLPSVALPSDHIPLIAQFQLAPAQAAVSNQSAAAALQGVRCGSFGNVAGDF